MLLPRFINPSRLRTTLHTTKIIIFALILTGCSSGKIDVSMKPHDSHANTSFKTKFYINTLEYEKIFDNSSIGEFPQYDKDSAKNKEILLSDLRGKTIEKYPELFSDSENAVPLDVRLICNEVDRKMSFCEGACAAGSCLTLCIIPFYNVEVSEYIIEVRAENKLKNTFLSKPIYIRREESLWRSLSPLGLIPPPGGTGERTWAILDPEEKRKEKMLDACAEAIVTGLLQVKPDAWSKSESVTVAQRKLRQLLLYKNDNPIVPDESLIWMNSIPISIDWTTSRESHPLIDYSYSGNYDMVSFLLKNGTNPDVENAQGITPLMASSYNGHEKIAEELIQYIKCYRNGFDATRRYSINHKNKYGSTSLIEASYAGHTNIIKMLFKEGADINSANNDGVTSLMASSFKKHKDVVALLLDNNPTLDASDKNGYTALMMASIVDAPEIVGLLLERGADVDTNDKYHNTALMIASAYNHLDVVKLLIAKGANINACNNSGYSALQIATAINYKDIVNFISSRDVGRK